MIALGANEPSNNWRLIGEICSVGISFWSTYEESIKESVEPESTRDGNLSIAEVSAECSVRGNSVVRNIRSDLS